MGRIISLDVGRKRIGLAISDELGWTAQGLETLERTNLKSDLAAVASQAKSFAFRFLLEHHLIAAMLEIRWRLSAIPLRYAAARADDGLLP